MDLLGQLRQGISKAVQKATDNQISIYHDFPECTLLNNTDRLSIKLSDPGIHHTLVNQWRPESAELNNVAFYIRDEDNRKQPVLTAQLQAGNGLLVKDMSGRAIMVVRPPQQSIDSIGKLMHPAPATLYKIMRLPGTMNYSVAKSPNGDAVFHIEKSEMAPVMKGYDGKMRWMESVEKKLPRGGQVFSFNLKWLMGIVAVFALGQYAMLQRTTNPDSWWARYMNKAMEFVSTDDYQQQSRDDYVHLKKTLGIED